MKRSEMIKIINQQMNDVSDKDFTPYAAELLLNKIEELGMLPPKRWREKNYGDGHKLTYAQWTQLPSEVNKWEPE